MAFGFGSYKPPASSRCVVDLSVPLVLEYEEVLQEKKRDLGLTEAGVELVTSKDLLQKIGALL